MLLDATTPVSRWSAHLTMRQLAAVSARFNHTRGLATDMTLRNAVAKLVAQCRLRVYRIIEVGCRCPEVRQKETRQSDGLLSGKFTGRITCTPQNNCGLSTVASSSTWLDSLTKRAARVLTKIENVMLWVDELCPLAEGRCWRAAAMKGDILGADWALRVRGFRESAVKHVTKILDADQLQPQLIRSIAPSILGIDCAVRQEDAETEAAASREIWEAAERLVPGPCSVWLNAFLKYQRADYVLESPLSAAFPDIREACVAHAFEIATRRDGRNTFGFLETFFVRPEEAQNVRSTLRGMADHSAPMIVKIGAEYVVKFAGRPLCLACEDMSEAIVTWAVCFKRSQDWRLGSTGIDLTGVYEPVLAEWCAAEPC